MCPPQYVFLSVVGLPIGVVAALRPSTVARIAEIVDAIGRAPSGRVEPAEWNVLLTRVLGAAVAVLGGGAALTCLL